MKKTPISYDGEILTFCHSPNPDSDTTRDVRRLIRSLPPGEVPDSLGLDRILSACWDEFDGSEKGGMEGYKLINRMEQVVWEPPIQTFVLERHGGTECGSTRAELQHWSVEFGEMTAEITKTGYRQLYAMAARASIKSMAAEITQQILNSDDDDHIQWLEDGSVKVRTCRLFPTNSGYKRTVEGRRQRLCGYIGDVLNDNGWEKLGWNRFRKNNIAHS